MPHTKLWIIATLSIQLALPLAAAQANEVVVGTGSTSGYYYSVARGLVAVLATEYGLRPTLKESAGSIENLESLDSEDSRVNLAFAQSDALQFYLEQHPSFSEEVVEVGRIGRECAYFVVSRTGDIKTATELKTGRTKKLAIGGAGSGPGVTWQTIQRLDPAYRNTQATDMGYIEALLELNRSSSEPKVDAVLMIHRPRKTPTPMEVVLGQREKFRLLPVTEADFARTSLDPEHPIYSFEEVQVGPGKGFSARVQTLCTEGLLLASKKKLSEEGLDAVTRAMSSGRDFIAPGTR